MGKIRHTRKRHTLRKHKRKRTRRRRTRRRTGRGGFSVPAGQLPGGGGRNRRGGYAAILGGGYKEGVIGLYLVPSPKVGGRRIVYAISDRAPGDKRGMASDRRKANKFLKAAKRKSRKHKRKRIKH